jgi:hypothetical protein
MATRTFNSFRGLVGAGFLLASAVGAAQAQNVTGHDEKAELGDIAVTLTGNGLSDIDSVSVGGQAAAVQQKSDKSASIIVFHPSGALPVPGTTSHIIVKFKNGKSQTLDGEFSWPIGYAQVTGPLAFPDPDAFTCDTAWDQQGVQMTGIVQYSTEKCPNNQGVNSNTITKLGTATVGSDSPDFKMAVAFKNNGTPLHPTGALPHVDGTGAVFTVGISVCTVKSGSGVPGSVGGSPQNASCDNWDGYKGTWQPFGAAATKVLNNTGTTIESLTDQLSIKVDKLFDDKNLVRTLLFSVQASQCFNGGFPGGEPCAGVNLTRLATASLELNVVRAPLARVQLNTLPWAIVYEPPGDKSTAAIQFNEQYNTNFTVTDGSGTTNINSTETSDQIQASLKLTASSDDSSGAAAGTFGTSWDNTTLDSFGTTKTDAGAKQATTSFSFGATVGPISSLIPGSGATCPSETSCVPLIADPGAYANEPFWQDTFFLMIHPQFATWEQVAGKRLTVMTGAVPVLGGMTVADLAACATGQGAIPGIPPCEVDVSDYQVKASDGKDITYDTRKLKVTLTAREAANLLKLDPFYGAGQSVKSLGVRATTPVASLSYGAHANDQPKSASLNVQNTEQTTQTSTDATQYAAHLTTVVGNSSSLGLSLTFPIVGESLTIGSSDKETGEIDTTVSYQDSTAVSKTKMTTATGTLADQDNKAGGFAQGHGPLPQTPSALVYFDRKFGGFMFVDPNAPGPPTTPLNLVPIVVRGALLKEAKRSRYVDVPAGSADHDAIGLVSRAGWMTGQGVDKFAPADPISRADFAAMLAKALDLSAKNHAASFSDVAATEIHAAEIAAVVDAGYMQPTSATTFAPSTALAVKDMVSALAKAFNKAFNHDSPTSSLPQPQTDAASISRGKAASAVIAAMLGNALPAN